MLSKPAANKISTESQIRGGAKPFATNAPAEKAPALLPSEIIYAFSKLKDDALIIEHHKMRANSTNTTFFGGVFLNRLDPRKPTAAPVKTPLTIMMVACPVFAGCRKKTDKDKSKEHCGTFTTKSVFTYEGREEKYGEARVLIAEAFVRKMTALLTSSPPAVEYAGKNVLTTGVQMDVEDENDKPAPGKKKKRTPMLRDEFIIRVKIPFKKEKGQSAPSNNAEPECIIRDIAQSQKGPDGRRKYAQPVMVTVDGAKQPLGYGNMPNFLLGGSEITGIEFCDSWNNSEMAIALDHKFKEIIVKRGTGGRAVSLVGAIDESYFDKMAEGANTDESIANAQREEALKAGEDESLPPAAAGLDVESLPPADPEANLGEDDFGDELDVESEASTAPLVKIVVKPPAAVVIKAAPKLTTPAEQKPKSPATKPAATAPSTPKQGTAKGGKKPAATPPPAPVLDAELDLEEDAF